MKRRAAIATAALAGLIVFAPAARADDTSAFPVEVQDCFERVRFTAPPRRAVVNDANMVQTFIDLGLADRMLAVSAIGGRERVLRGAPGVVAGLRQYSHLYPTLEAVLSQDPDFMFAGWSYGFDAARGVAPQGLRELGIASYTLRESCIRIGRREPMSMEVVYADVLALGSIFGVRPRAEAMVADFRARVADVTARLANVKQRPRVMYCGDCSSTGAPLTSGAEGMPALLANLAGGRNIFDDIPNSYVRVSWEEVVSRDPQWILVSDDRISAQRHIDHLLADPQLASVEAVRERRFIAVTYPERSPSTRNVEALERVARILHPEASGAPPGRSQGARAASGGRREAARGPRQ